MAQHHVAAADAHARLTGAKIRALEASSATALEAVSALAARLRDLEENHRPMPRYVPYRPPRREPRIRNETDDDVDSSDDDIPLAQLAAREERVVEIDLS